MYFDIRESSKRFTISEMYRKLAKATKPLSEKFAGLVPRLASTLVVAEHDGKAISASTLSAVTAAKKIGGDISILVVGSGIEAAVSSASKISGVKKVLSFDDAAVKTPIAEAVSEVVNLALKDYSHILAPSSNHGKNFMPRVAAMNDSAPITDVIDIVDESTFKRPMYAGNVISTVKMSDAKKFLLIRQTAFDKAAKDGGSASVEKLSGAVSKPITSFVSAKGITSDRPDLTSAR